MLTIPLLLGVLVSGRPLADTVQAPNPISSPAEVYAAVIADSRCSGAGAAGARGGDIVVVRETVLPATQWWWNAFPHEDFLRGIPKWLPGIKPQTLQSFLELTARPALVDPAIAVNGNMRFISRTTVDALAKEGAFWTVFYQRNPSATGLIELSAVGLAPDGHEALVYCGRHSESLSGSGHLVLLRRDGERWRAVAWRQVWQS